MVKLLILVVLSAGGGVVAGDWLDGKLGDTLTKDAQYRKAQRIGLQAGTGTLIFALASSLAK